MANSRIEIRERSFALDDQEIHYRLVRRSGRRSLTMELEPREGLSVLAPRRLPMREVNAFLNREQDWLRRRLAEVAVWERAHPPRAFDDGDLLPLLGESWTLTLIEEPGRRQPRVERELSATGPGRIRLWLQAGLGPELRRETAARSLERWYRRLARALLSARVEHWQARLGRRPAGLAVRDTRSRWGSCSATGKLSFCWRIVMAPPAVLDYLVVHELCHLVHPDHSPRFWAQVECLLPDYVQHRHWLRDRGSELYL